MSWAQFSSAIPFAETVMMAGRELDALVAERVMGWKRPTREFQPWDKTGEGMVLCTPHELPRFSEDIAAAWQVVERLHSEGWMLRLWLTDYGWHASFLHSSIREDDDSRLVEVSAGAQNDTAPLAICLVALMAVGMKVSS